MNEIKYKARWKDTNKKIKDFMEEYGIDALRDSCLIVDRYTCLDDKKDIEVWSGDLRHYRGKLYKVVDYGWRFCFERNMMEDGENKSIAIDEDAAFESELIGNIQDGVE